MSNSITTVLDVLLQVTGNGRNELIEAFPAVVNLSAIPPTRYQIDLQANNATALFAAGTINSAYTWCIIIPSASNTATLALRSVVGDVGIALTPGLPVILPIIPSQTSIAIANLGTPQATDAFFEFILC
jgi:hypothetical protein